MGAVPGPSRPASQVPQCCHSVRNGGAVTGVGGRDSGPSHVGNGGLTPSDPGAVEEWLALMPPYGGQVSGRAVCPFCRGVASSEAETFFSLEGRLATLE